jgi:hypothetical protein
MTQLCIVLALDFDGVTHPVNSGTELKFFWLDQFEAWLRGRPSNQRTRLGFAPRRR